MVNILSCTPKAIKKAARSLLSGNLVAFPTETVYGLGADASNERAIARIFEVKGRPIDHPLIVHISSILKLDLWARDVPEYALKLAHNFWPGPMTLILHRSELAKDFITGGQDTVGIRVPQDLNALELLKQFESQGGNGVAAPSANRFGKVSPTSANDVIDELSCFLKRSDLILDGGSAQIGIESTIIDCTQTSPEILRYGGLKTTSINELLKLPVRINRQIKRSKIKASGLLETHYSPEALIQLHGVPLPGDGYIALSKYPTPTEVFRLADPENTDEYARVLYRALRLADSKRIKRVIVIPPEGDDIAVAICDRLKKASKIKS